MKTLVLATHNQGKLAEIKSLLTGFEIELSPDEIEETGKTFAENALLKAHAAAHKTQKLALADDSGLCVEALDGAPGIFSARWCGPAQSPQVGMQRVHDEVEKAQDKKDNRAKFATVMALAWPDGRQKIFEGFCKGTIVWPPRQIKGRGFGYDPIFQPEGFDKTFGEMTPAEKESLSHRAMALQKVIAFLKICQKGGLRPALSLFS